MKRIPTKLKPWFEARRRFKLSHAHTQMARELGMNPRKLGLACRQKGRSHGNCRSRSLSSNATVKALADQSQSMCDLWKKWYRLKRCGAKRSKRARPRRCADEQGPSESAVPAEMGKGVAARVEESVTERIRTMNVAVVKARCIWAAPICSRG